MTSFIENLFVGISQAAKTQVDSEILNNIDCLGVPMCHLAQSTYATMPHIETAVHYGTKLSNTLADIVQCGYKYSDIDSHVKCFLNDCNTLQILQGVEYAKLIDNMYDHVDAMGDILSELPKRQYVP